MNKTLNILAAAATLVLANAANAPVADAGGVRLQFGFPLGSFTTRPSGNGGGVYSRHSAPRYNDYAEHRRAAARRAAMVAEAKREAAAKARREAIAEAKREALADARREKLAAEKAEARRLARVEADKEETTDVASIETASLAPNAAPVPARPELVEAAVGQPKTTVTEQPVTTAESAKPAKTAKAETSNRPLDCKRFVPSAGLTITVPCAE